MEYCFTFGESVIFMSVCNMIPDASDDALVRKLIDAIRNNGGGISSSASPIIVPVKVENNSEINDCFVSVEKKIQRDGGNSILGWALRKEQFLMSAEFHAIWKSPQGEFLDITPKGFLVPHGQDIMISTDKIMFVIAPHASYEGKQVPNVNINMSGNPLVDDIIVCFDCKFVLFNKGDRALQYGTIELTGQEANDFQNLEIISMGLHAMANRNLKSKNALCFCGTNERYKHCHRRILKQIACRAGITL